MKELIHPCKCTSYNGGQCYNCINGAHDICSAKKKCKVKRSKHVGLIIVWAGFDKASGKYLKPSPSKPSR